ncbi:probable D-lactate dehydrogenase, mitochondrial [Physella acuta]|uniref:probable D-lactate dehydrogenase, mitochondrial n=1 Tax=Physella acuta TaxID=109671 RepID=UPI0027DC2C0C|nr:probable D-lactate dehydrogenase, mitochondrial [Physella acuta]
MLYFSTALVPGSKAYSTDVCVPVSHLPEVLVKTRQWIDEAKVIGPIVGHVGDGNFHVLFPVNHADKETFLKVQDLHFKMAYLAMEKDGTCTGEHGIGMGKRKLLTKEFGETGIQVLKEVKKCFDPNGIMNPGKMFF